jgi:hypothetical protein
VPVERGEKWKHTPPGAAAVCVAAVIIALLSFVSSETVLAVKRPAYPIEAEPPEGGHWLIIGTDDSDMLARGVDIENHYRYARMVMASMIERD